MIKLFRQIMYQNDGIFMKICLKPSPLAFSIQKTENSEIVITSWSFQLFGLFGLVEFQLFSIGQTAADVSANNALYVYLPKKNRGYAPVLAVICTCKTTKEYCMSLAGVKLSFFLPFSKERKKTKKIEGGWQSIVAYLEVGARFRKV